ncbi:BNR-4 repeat-containing protein [uncultured Polaribacter sp.]|uniref:BNR-4 repeat-containing protein n=1 Tax=uncultured Polaribacter sp. TaxID=174711 RepID=UPI00260E5D20|nr:BNR-4 repeat-containing protein [uncultured Polaribacter sp.]
MTKIIKNKGFSLLLIFLLISYNSFSQVTLEKEVKITDIGLHFNGRQIDRSLTTNNGNPDSYDFVFGRAISARTDGDSVQKYGNYIFLTWYKGGKMERNVMLSRYNLITGNIVTIEFPHRHTGYINQWWLGESHNYISVAVSPIDGSIHLLYDMHAYSRTRPRDGSFSKDYFRYSYSVKNAALLPDDEFTIDKFIEKPNAPGTYRHLSLNSGRPGFPVEEYAKYQALTYPRFFINDANELLMYIREGGNNNGAYKFTKYDANTSTWSNFTNFNVLNARRQSGIEHNWGLYGTIKYVNGKIRIGFQRRSGDNNDKYVFQNGVYYAYSDNQDGSDSWKNHSGEPFSVPLFDADKIKVMEPGDYVPTTQQNKVRIVDGFDWTVTENEDVHIISKVRDTQNNITKNLHTYKPAGATDFITSEDFSGGSAIYTSGESIFLIGLKNNRVSIEKAAGGTNNFTTVYEATSGKRFENGRVYINDGKLYYFLLERGTSSARPLYLQVIDLDIPATDPTLPSNFTIQALGETCANAENGSLIINAAATHSYMATINNVAYEFTKNTTIENLSPGTYDICIDVVGKDHTSCYQVSIEEAATLSAKIDVSKRAAQVSVASGTAPYTVIKNGIKILETNQTNFSVPVNNGDTIQVKSKEACQGEMSKTINLLEDVKAYPNPSNGLFELFIPNDITTIAIEIYNVQSRLLVAKTYQVTNGKVQLDLQNRPKGMYFVKVNSSKPVFVKVIKK